MQRRDVPRDFRRAVTPCGRSNEVRRAFGDLPRNAEIITLGQTCNWFLVQAGYNPINESDIQINKVDAAWTTASPSTCSANTPTRWNVEAIVTHERGHSLGMGHTPDEPNHRYQTMSPLLNAQCGASEINLGRGDALTLTGKY